MTRKCKICGAKMKLTVDRRYEITKIPVGLMALTEPAITYEAFDCPKCGCQNIVNEREGNE